MKVICPNCGKEFELTSLEHDLVNLEGFCATCDCGARFDLDFDPVSDTFITDIPKMADFKVLSKETFLGSYRYLTEDEYDATALYANWLNTIDKKQDNYFEAVEVCPHCDGENIYPMWDPEVSGYVAVCKHCGKEIMLCDECFHAADNEAQKCDFCATGCGGKCFRGSTM